MNSVQTVTLNNAPSQNWVGCTVRTPRTQIARTLRAQCPCRGRCCAHTARAVPMSWALLRAQQACRAHVARAASASRAHAGRALVATRPGSLPPRSRPHFDVATPRQPESCRDIKSVSRHHPDHSMSRHQIGVATSFLLPSPSQVATSRPGLDLPGDEPMSRHHFHVATSFLPTVGFPGRDTKIPGRDLPHNRPCCDIKSMSRRRFFPTKAYQVATPLPVATSACRDLQTR